MILILLERILTHFTKYCIPRLMRDRVYHKLNLIVESIYYRYRFIY